MTATGPQIIGARRFTGDTGGVDPALRAVLNSFAKRGATDRDVLEVLGGVRLLIPVVALPTETTTEADGLKREKRSDVALPIMVGEDGRRGVLAFTCVDAMQRWRRDARPVPAYVGEACQAVLDESADALVIDVAGPVTYAVENYFLGVFAQEGAVPEAKADSQVLATVYRVTQAEADIDRVRVLGSDRADLGIRLELHRRDDSMVRRVAQKLRDELRPMLPSGVELSAVVRAQVDEK